MNIKLAIIGSGPAGYTAAIYAARAGLEPHLICGIQKGGQLTITKEVENYPGFADPIEGPWLMEQMELQAKRLDVRIIEDQVIHVDLSRKPFVLTLERTTPSVYMADSVIICTGAEAKWLGLESEKKFLGYGVSGCATCDGFFYNNKVVMVVGGGNTAVSEALYLTKHASKVILMHRRDKLRAEHALQQKLFAHPKISVIWDSAVEEIVGEDNPKNVTGVRVKNFKDNQSSLIKIDGLFVAIGHKPNTAIFKGQLDLDEEGYIITEKGSTRTGVKGVFAAGDVQDKIFKQAITAAGTGCMAAQEADEYLETLKAE